MVLGSLIATAAKQPVRRIIAAKERSAVNIPHAELIAAGGSLNLVEDALDRSLVQISQGIGQLQLRIGGVIGRLPITDHLALDISPKFPISNLARLLEKSDQSLDHRVSADRLYDFSEWNGYLPELLLRSFALELINSDAEGTHRTYQRFTRADIPKPKLDFRRSEQQYWARGIPTKAIVDGFDFSKNNAVNRVLKAAIKCALPLAANEPSLRNEASRFAHTQRTFGDVGNLSIYDVDDECERAIRELPQFKPGHAKAVLIGRELIKRASPVLEFADQRMSLPSFLINLDKVFESYVRNCLRLAAVQSKTFCRVEDGNQSAFGKPLFNDNNRFNIMPDLLIFDAPNVGPRVVGDVKYKTKPTEEDRYQVITHALSYQSHRAVLIYPKRNDGPTGLIRLGEVGPKAFPMELSEYHFDLANDLEAEELRMNSSLLSL